MGGWKDWRMRSAYSLGTCYRLMLDINSGRVLFTHGVKTSAGGGS